MSDLRDAYLAALRSATLANQPAIAVGGRIFLSDSALARRVGADRTASDAAEAVRELNQRVRQRPQAA